LSKGDTGIQGPQGLKGDTGAQGPKGDKGDTGATGPELRPVVGTVAVLPTVTPRYAGDYVIDTAGKAFISTGLTTGDWFRIAPTTYVDTADNFIIINLLNNKKLWTGTQATYDGLTKDPNTIYFITG